ncbi:MAG: archaellin/type IV pilin N-terminal domain-containing protein [Halanaeroarchaeum sp.]
MFEFIHDPDERGQVGIGTLIVFIAMVLVAAIAAGVLINTAGFLQTKSQATGEEASAQVSNRVQVVAAYGNVNTATDNVTDNTIDYINISVMRSPGADNINVSKATINWIGPKRATTLTYVSSVGGLNSETFTTVQIQGDDQVLKNEDTRIKVVINSTLVKNDVDSLSSEMAGLDEGEEVSLTITTQYGSKTPVLLTAPESLTNKQAVRLA